MTTILTAIGIIFVAILAIVFEPISGILITILDKVGLHIGDKYGLKGTVEKPTPTPTIAVGAMGVAKTHLRPSGFAMFDGVRCDVIAKEKSIDRDDDIQVCRIEGNRIYVERR